MGGPQSAVSDRLGASDILAKHESLVASRAAGQKGPPAGGQSAVNSVFDAVLREDAGWRHQPRLFRDRELEKWKMDFLREGTAWRFRSTTPRRFRGSSRDSTSPVSPSASWPMLGSTSASWCAPQHRSRSGPAWTRASAPSTPSNHGCVRCDPSCLCPSCSSVWMRRAGPVLTASQGPQRDADSYRCARSSAGPTDRRTVAMTLRQSPRGRTPRTHRPSTHLRQAASAFGGLVRR